MKVYSEDRSRLDHAAIIFLAEITNNDALQNKPQPSNYDRATATPLELLSNAIIRKTQLTCQPANCMFSYIDIDDNLPLDVRISQALADGLYTFFAGDKNTTIFNMEAKIEDARSQD